MVGAESNSGRFVSGTAVDSRHVKAGDLFFALPGAKVDGHAYLSDAATRGAVGAVVHAAYEGSDHGMDLIRVPDALEALQTLARKKLQEMKLRIIAVTGSIGKTTTKDFITTLLSGKYRVAASPGNSNSQIGLPLTILNRVRGDEEIAVFEMGMTAPGQIGKLVSIAPPEVAVVTKVALVHACNFESIEGIAAAKAEIFSHPATRLGIYHQESDYGFALSRTGGCNKLSFSTLDTSVESLLPQLHLPGKHNRHNFLAAVAVARYFGLDWDEIRNRQDLLALPERRLQFIERDGVTFINDAYNASELSMKAALETMPQPHSGGRRIAVLGGMVELGKFSADCHKAVGLHALGYVDLLFCFGEESKLMEEVWRLAGRQAIWREERSQIVSLLREILKPGDVVLLKGSRSKEVNKVLEEL